MNRIEGMASFILGSLGVALLLLSFVLVPESRALADDPTDLQKTCAGMSCLTPKCTAYWPLNNSCPDKCIDSGLVYCKCQTDPTTCLDCVCAKTFGEDSCTCRVK